MANYLVLISSLNMRTARLFFLCEYNVSLSLYLEQEDDFLAWMFVHLIVKDSFLIKGCIELNEKLGSIAR